MVSLWAVPLPPVSPVHPPRVKVAGAVLRLPVRDVHVTASALALAAAEPARTRLPPRAVATTRVPTVPTRQTRLPPMSLPPRGRHPRSDASVPMALPCLAVL